MTDDAVAAWTALLDRFEHDLAADAELAPWEAPAEPLPAALAGRAEGLLRRQQERLRRQGEELHGVREQLGALRQVPQARTGAPAYLDIDA